MKFNAVAVTAQKRTERLITAFRRILDRGVFLNGDESRRFEKNLERWFPRGYVTSVASGHDSLLFAILALKLTPHDEVLFPVNAYPTAFPIVLAGAKPIPVDVDSNGQLDPVKFQQAVSSKTKAVIVVHLYGLVGNLERMIDICKKHHLTLIEDCAQAFGSQYQGKPVGTFGDISCFSFYPTKNLGALGDGGAIWARKKSWHEFFLASKAYGEKTRYGSEFIAGHSRLPEIQAGALNVYLRHVDSDIRRRRAVWRTYEKEFRAAKLTRFVRMLQSDPQSQPAQHLLVVEVEKRDGLEKFLKSRDIPTLVHYPRPVHLVPAFFFLKYKRGDFPVSERLAGRILSLPFHPYLTRKEVVTVVQSIRDFYHG